MITWQAIIDFVATEDYIPIKAGGSDHKHLPIWMVVVNNKIFARSWSLKKGWYNILQSEGKGSFMVSEEEVGFTSRQEESPSLLAEIDRAYQEKYGEKWPSM